MKLFQTLPHSFIHFSTSILFVISFLFAFTSCQKDEDKAPDTRTLFVGNYQVEDLSASSGYTYNYEISIANVSGQLQISNFADMLNKPVQAIVEGTKLTIPSQTFNGTNGAILQVSGSGTLTGNLLNFTYKTTGALTYNGTCKATKK